MTPTSSNALRLSALAAAMLLSGCAVLSAPSTVEPDSAMTAVPAIAPSTNAAVQSTLSIDRWWLAFEDDALNRSMDEALRQNADLEIAAARVREAQANLDAARASLWPTLDAQARAGREQKSEVSAMPLPPSVGRQMDSRTVSLQTGYEVDLWGKLSSSRSAARHQYLASAWGRAAMEWTLTAQVAEAYFSLAMVDRQIDISQAMRASRETTLRLRQREHEVGAGNEFDLRRAEAEVASTDSTLISLARQRVSLDRTLMLLLGRNPSQIVAGKLERRMLDESKESIPVLPQGDVNEFLLRRPDIKQAEAQLAASNANIEAARAAALPALRLTGAIGSDAKSVSDLFSAPAAIWSLAASLTQSIFDGGQAEARIRGEHARAEQSLASYRKTIATAVLDVREAYATLDLTQQAYRAEHTRVASLGRAREIAKAGYDAGALNYLDLLDAERNLYQAQLQKVTATRDQLVGQVAAFKALGGGYAPQPQTLAQK